MHEAFLSMGSNMGDKKQNIDKAVSLLDSHKEIKVLKISSYYETEPVGYTDQDWFLNIVVKISTDLDPYALLDYCHNIEQQLKRVRKIHWGPRTIDLDILLYDNVVNIDEVLTIPHPRMKERAFVMIPLHEIAPNIKIDNIPINNIIDEFKGEKIKKLME